MPSFQHAIDLIAFGLSVLLAHRLWKSSRRQLPLPPGPRGWPVIGNIFDVPKHEVHIAYTEMSHEYKSDLLYFNMAGTSILILNSTEATNDLLGKRSTLYSNRPPFPMINDLFGWDYNIGFIPYGDRWRKSRALFKQQFTPARLRTYQKPQVVEGVARLLKRLLDTPRDFENHIRLFSSGVILSSAYGITVENSSNPYLQLVERAVHAMSEAAIPGTYLVDTFPMLKYVPKWFPGAGFKRKAAQERLIVERMTREPLNFTKNNMANGTAKSSIASRELQKMQDEGSWSEEKEDLLKGVLGTLYAGGSDTTATATNTIFLGLVRNRDILKKGQAAVDAVVGRGRLPDFGDEGKIPYVDALVMEGLRWRPIVPLALPHHLVCADIYRGYHIPANTIVMGNCWFRLAFSACNPIVTNFHFGYRAILHNPATYGEDVEQFRPERFLNPDGTINHEVPYPDTAFGFGRRVCAGKVVAQSSVWLAVASLLACFDLEKVKDSDGVEIDPSTDYIDGLLPFPRPYECSIKPRSMAVEKLIRQSVEQM
ncbi:hypothetical protein GYMLUDRAFT_220252 [Collybiopsis luxurians FD-317 M1]|nr:hypothetical protein GYMLUDRAFT_220252 [Collybiopsis luxurians FD-317 M1]